MSVFLCVCVRACLIIPAELCLTLPTFLLNWLTLASILSLSSSLLAFLPILLPQTVCLPVTLLPSVPPFKFLAPLPPHTPFACQSAFLPFSL